ncbi:MAG: hypothetical protein ACR2K2_15505 [Mycobacteriales bacterium]
MGLRDTLLRIGTAAPHVLVVSVPGAAPLRWAAEQWLDAQGWPRAASPADADLLVECGVPGPQLAPRIAVAWEGLPGPRARARLEDDDATRVAAALLAARAALRDLDGQLADARDRTAPRLAAGPTPDDAAGRADADPDDMDHGDMDHGDMDMGGMDMDLPGGLAMAGRAQDRDGLRLEGLRLRLGPILPGWPAGVELDVVLSGDVLSEVTARRLDARAEPTAPPAVLALDGLALLLEAADWPDGARRARRARAEGGGGPATGELMRRLRSARLLRWSLRDLPAPAGRSVVEHVAVLLGVIDGTADLPSASPEELGHAIRGLDLGPAGVVLAAFGPALDRAAAHA